MANKSCWECISYVMQAFQLAVTRLIEILRNVNSQTLNLSKALELLQDLPKLPTPRYSFATSGSFNKSEPLPVNSSLPKCMM